MRIVSGSAKGRRLRVPDGDATRPTTDRVREATFNALFSMDAIDGAHFCDLFAGSGALGLEALSRGAAAATFVERDRSALIALRDNIASLGFEDRSTIWQTDAVQWAAGKSDIDVWLADPPYAFDQWKLLLDRISDGIVVAESDSPVDPHERWEITRERRYGSTVVCILQARLAGKGKELAR